MSARGTTVIVPDDGNPARNSTASRDGFSGPHSIATEDVPRVSHASVTGSPACTTAGVAVKLTTSGENPNPVDLDWLLIIPSAVAVTISRVSNSRKLVFMVCCIATHRPTVFQQVSRYKTRALGVVALLLASYHSVRTVRLVVHIGPSAVSQVSL